jgi:succinyl-diaminopimelate desuccinylase
MKPLILPFLKQLIAVPSTKENPQALQQVLDLVEKELPGFTVERFERNGVPSLLFYNSAQRPDRFKMIFNAHLDVVPAQASQFTAVVKDAKLFGRGVYDMKGGGAVQILLFKELAKSLQYPIALQLVTDEEIGGTNAADYQIEQGIRTDFALAGEPTDLRINNQTKGIIWVKITTKGKTAHGAFVWLGENALEKVDQILQKIKAEFPNPKEEKWVTTVNISHIDTPNQTFNKIPDEASLYLDCRFIAEDSKRIHDFFSSLEKDGAQVEIAEDAPAQYTDPKNAFIGQLQQVAKGITGIIPENVSFPYGTDMRYFSDVGCDSISFGPLGGGMHSDNEWVDIKSLYTMYDVLKEFLKKI